MDLNTVLTIFGYVAAAAFALLTHVAQKNAAVAELKDKLTNKAVNLINDAEEEYSNVYKAGSQKFEWVVDMLYRLVPENMKFLVSKDEVAVLVQRTFNGMEEFADQQVTAAVERINKAKD